MMVPYSSCEQYAAWWDATVGRPHSRVVRCGGHCRSSSLKFESMGLGLEEIFCENKIN